MFNSKKIFLIALFFCSLFFSDVSNAGILFKDFSDLSERDISPQGKTALNLEDTHWYHAETKHFIYHFTSYEDAMQAYYDNSEIYYEWIKQVFGIQKDEWQKKIHVFVFTDDWKWKRFGERAGKEIHKMQAFSTGWELFFHHPKEPSAVRPTLAHELTHVILFRFLDGEPPLVLNEGFAEFVRYMVVTKDRGYDNNQIKLIMPISPQNYVPLNEFMSWQRYPSTNAVIVYTEGEALVRYLILTYGGPKFYSLVRDLARGKAFEKAFETIYQESASGLNERFRLHATKKG